MNRFPLSYAFAALLAGSLAAQAPYFKIDIIIPNGAWVVAPANSLHYNTFQFSSGPEYISCGVATEIGTSVTAGFHTRAGAQFTGNIAGGPTLSHSWPTQTDGGMEIYTYVAGGGPNPVPISTVTCNLIAHDHSNSAVLQSGPGAARGVANASVTVSCPSYALAASCQAKSVLPTATIPQSGSVTLTGITNWWIAMSATGDASGTMTGPVATLYLAAVCIADGTVTLD